MVPTGVCADTLTIESVRERNRVTRAKRRMQRIGAFLEVDNWISGIAELIMAPLASVRIALAEKMTMVTR